MKKTRKRFIHRPTRLDDLSFDDLYEDTDDWREKAERLQARRWRKILKAEY